MTTPIILVVLLLPLLSTCAPTAPSLARASTTATTASNRTTARAFTNKGFITAYRGAEFDGGDRNPVVRGHAFTFYADKKLGTGCVWKFICDRRGADLFRVRIDVSSEMPMGLSMSYDGVSLVEGMQVVNNELEVYPVAVPKDTAEMGLLVVCVEETSAYCCVGGAYVEVRRLTLRKQLP